MREIKFRAYAQVGKSWIYWDVYDEYPQGIYGGLSDPQQYTGLKDKNGVEIYEGDIIEFLLVIPEHEIEHYYQYEIIYHNGYIGDGSAGTSEYSIVFSGFAAKGTKGWDEGRTRSIGRYPDEQYHGICGVTVDDYEVIGNIFEGVNK